MRKKLAAIITCIVMAVAFMPTYAFALTSTPDAQTTPFHYVALGDASAAGFGMAEEVGYQKVAEGSYPDLIRDALTENQFDVTLDQMAMNGMRVEELRYLLDDSYNGDAYLTDNFEGLSQLRPDYRASIADADLITYGLGTVDFGSFIIYAAKDIEGSCSDNAIKALADADAEGIKASLKQALTDEAAKINSAARSAAQAMGYDIDEMINEYSDDYIAAAAYVYYSFCTSFDESIRLIKEQNPNADILVLKLHNMLGNLTLKAFGAEFAIGALYNTQLIEKANAHMQSVAGIYGFIDTADVQTFLGEVAAYDGNLDNISDQFKYYCDVLEDDFLLEASLKDTLKGYTGTRKKMGMNGAYDTAEQALRSVANLSKVTITTDNLTWAMDNIETIKAMPAKLMAGIKAKCLENAATAARTNSTNGYQGTLALFVDTQGPMYGTDKDTDRPIGNIIMAVGIRTQMGDGFFQHPSALGHSQIKDKVLNAYKDKDIHFGQQDPTCTHAGSKSECWLNVVTGKCYADAAHTQEVVWADLIIPATGHEFGEITVITPAEFCKDGVGSHECSKCHTVEKVVLDGLGPKNTKLLKPKAGKKSFTAKWKKPSKANLKKTTGYELRYDTSKKMENAKTVVITKNKTVSKTVKKLKAKKKYFIQIRTYKNFEGKNYYSKWSAVKSVKTK